MSNYQVPAFLSELLHARSPSGYESEAQAVFDRHVKPAADTYANDALGNRIATLNPAGDPVLMLAGHMDELGLIITYVNKDGYLYFDTIGGHDRSVISGRRVIIQTANGPVKGVTGKRAIHLMDEGDRKKVPEIHEIWIDIGARSKKEALERVAIGDVATYDHELELITAASAPRGLSTTRSAPTSWAKPSSASRGRKRKPPPAWWLWPPRRRKSARAAPPPPPTRSTPTSPSRSTSATRQITPTATIASTVRPSSAAAPSSAVAQHQSQGLPAPARLRQEGEDSAPVRGRPRPTGTDARAIQMARGGVATGLVSIPLRYMHTPSEVVDLEDVENCVKLFAAFAKSVAKGESFNW
jgi:hypothetical protein